jgi:hypothetical protein
MKIVFVSMFLLVSVACAAVFSAGAELDKEFTLKKDESASVKGADLRIKMIGYGTAQQQSGGDTVFCKFEVTAGGKTQGTQLDVGESAKYGGASVKLVKVDPTTDPKAADPWSTTACSFIVTKAEK